MLDYVLVTLAAVLLGVNSAPQKLYQKRAGESLDAGLKFNILSGIFTAVIFFFINGFKFEINGFSALMAVGMTVFSAVYTLLGFKIIAMGKLVLYTAFLLTGGMLVPYAWGIVFLNEQLSLLRTLGIIVIIAAVILVNEEKSKLNVKQILMCVAVFFLNGFVSVISKEHQISSEAISANGFVLITGLARAVMCLPIYLFTRAKDADNAPKENTPRGHIAIMLIVLLGALISGVSSLLQLVGAENLPATVLYPIVTGGTIICTGIVGRIAFGEKLTKRVVLSMVLCLAGTCMFL